MASTSSIDFNIKGIGEVLKERRLVVPRYQRSYAWEKKHVTDLLQDVATAMNEGRDEYFLGSIVLLEEDQQLHVVDGQQRLATCSIIMAGIRDYFFEVSDNRSNQFETDYLMSVNRRTKDVQPNLVMNHEDQTFFQEYILQHVPKKMRRAVTTQRESHKKLWDAAVIVSKHLSRLTGTVSDPAAALLDLSDFLDAKVKVIRVKVPDGSNAFTIFETLNDRGLDLAISDLLKNYLFNKAEKRIDEAQHKWTEMIGALSAVDADRQLVSYIRHVWSTSHGLIRERDLYQSIKSKVAGSRGAMDVVNLFSDSARYYAAILSPTPDSWRLYPTEARGHMETLNSLRMTQVRPLILSVIRFFKESDTAPALKYIVSWSVRFLIMGKLGSGELETFYANMAQRVTKGEIRTIKQLRSEAKSVVPNDAFFREAFATATVSKSYLSRYYLRALEIVASGESSIEHLPNDAAEDVDLEHVMPENPGDGWKVDQAVFATHVNRLGNLALMKKEDNSNSGNGAFEDKIACYKKSAFILTKEVAAQRKWGAAEIVARQARLAELAIKTWPI